MAAAPNTSPATAARLTPNGTLLTPPPANLYSPHSTDDSSSPAGAGGGGVDFAALALIDAPLARHLKRNGQLDFSDADAVRALTQALLSRDFALTHVELPDDRLCPPVPNRWAYVCWVAALVESTQPGPAEPESERQGTEGRRRMGEMGLGRDREVLGVDVGTGASAIYPLLALRARASWRMVASEVDARNLGFARANVRRNFGGEGRCRVVEAEGTAEAGAGAGAAAWLFPLRALKDMEEEKVDFVMTNPPFYESVAEMVQCAEGKKRKPFSSCTGAEVEMVCEGGEVGFVGRLISESVALRDGKGGGGAGGVHVYVHVHVQWWTSMLGKLSSVDALVKSLRDLHCTNYAVTEFVQGSKTRRWGLAWSWDSWRPTNQVARGIYGLERRLWPVATEVEFEAEGGMVDVGKQVDEVVEELELDDEEGTQENDGVRWLWKPQVNVGVGVCQKGDCWSRKARRAREMERRRRMAAEDQDMHEAEGTVDDEPKLVFKISVRKGEHDDSSIVEVRWLRGRDAVLFESFCGWLKRKLKEG